MFQVITNNYLKNELWIKYTIIFLDRFRFWELIIRVTTYPQRSHTQSMIMYMKDLFQLLRS